MVDKISLGELQLRRDPLGPTLSSDRPPTVSWTSKRRRFHKDFESPWTLWVVSYACLSILMSFWRTAFSLSAGSMRPHREKYNCSTRLITATAELRSHTVFLLCRVSRILWAAGYSPLRVGSRAHSAWYCREGFPSISPPVVLGFCLSGFRHQIKRLILLISHNLKFSAQDQRILSTKNFKVKLPPGFL